MQSNNVVPALLITSVLAFMAAVTSLGQAVGRAAPVPTELRGTWNPMTPEQAQHSFRFDSAAIHLNSSSRAEAGAQVIRVEGRSAGDTTYYTIEYHDAGRLGTLRFAYFALPTPMVRTMGTRNLIWIKSH